MAAGAYAMDGDMFALPNVTASPFSEVDATTGASISEEARLTKIIVTHILIPVIAVLGVLGNVLNIVVLSRKWMRSSTNYYLTALAIYDILYLVFAFTLTVILRKPSATNAVVHVLIDIASNTGVWLTLTFTIERYIGVCHPMRGRVLCTTKRAKYVIASVCIAGALVTFPGYFRPVIGDWPSFKLGYMNLIQALFTYLPLTLLLIFNTLLVRSVMRASRERAAMMQGTTTSSRRARRAAEQTRVTTMLIVVVVVFLVCQLPQAVMNTVAATMETTDNLRILFSIGNLLVVINSAVNFVLYSSVSGKFRRTFRHVFLRCASRSEPARHNLFSEGNTHASPQVTTHLVTGSPAVSQRSSAVSQNGYEALAKSGAPSAKAPANNTAKSLVKNDFLQVNPDLRR